MNRKGILFVFGCLTLLFFYACSSKEDSSSSDNMAHLRILLTDDPTNYEAVNIDIQDVQINPDGSNNGWTSLEHANTGIFNLLALTGGLDTLLAEVELPAGRFSQLRLILGDNNTVQVNGETKDMKTPSGQQSGLKVLLNTDLTAGITYTILLDFDAARSVVKAGNSGQYLLKPVIRATVEAASGSIQGIITPPHVLSLIYAINDIDTLSTFTNNAGMFIVRGVPAGIYRVEIIPDTTSGFRPAVLQNVEVMVGSVTDVGPIVLEN